MPGTNNLGTPPRQPRQVTILEAPSSSQAAALPVNIVDPAANNVSQTICDDVEPVGFASKVNAAIDVRLGLPVARDRSPIPMTDAPLFSGEPPCYYNPGDDNADNVLPPRKQANHLVGLYWAHLDPLEPLLDRKQFYHSYQLLFDGKELDCDERSFVCLLNAMFALSTQLQEFLPSEQRGEASRTFFQRAWSLLRPEVILWELGSVEMVQCLLLIARYLQCTAKLQSTWMAVGAATRMAQGLGLHLSNDISVDHQHGEGRVTQQIWQCCVSMDRY